jgi:L-ascorbate metabolism protein UlaG (beta-lactamase superfamily)
MMDIVWHGNSSVSISEGKVRAVVDPDLAVGRIADAVSIDFAVCTRDDHGVKSVDKKVFDWPGEFEIKGVSFVGVETDGYGSALSFKFHFNGTSVALVTSLHEYPSDSFIERLGDVHVLLLSIAGGEDGLKMKEVYKLVEAVEPSVVIPIGWRDGDGLFSEFLKEMDVPMPEAGKKFSCKKGSLNRESMELAVLEVR